MERWLPVLGYEDNYEVSSLCRFRNRRNGHTVACSINKRNGYTYVHLSKNGVSRNYRAHRLMLATFSGEDKLELHARHLDGDKANNAIQNIAWGSVSQNRADTRRHGRLRGATPGNGHHNAKLSETDIKLIFLYRNKGMLQHEIAKMFGTCQANISLILAGKAWKHISDT